MESLRLKVDSGLLNVPPSREKVDCGRWKVSVTGMVGAIGEENVVVGRLKLPGETAPAGRLVPTRKTSGAGRLAASAPNIRPGTPKTQSANGVQDIFAKKPLTPSTYRRSPLLSPRFYSDPSVQISNGQTCGGRKATGHGHTIRIGPGVFSRRPNYSPRAPAESAALLDSRK